MLALKCQQRTRQTDESNSQKRVCNARPSHYTNLGKFKKMCVWAHFNSFRLETHQENHWTPSCLKLDNGVGACALKFSSQCRRELCDLWQIILSLDLQICKMRDSKTHPKTVLRIAIAHQEPSKWQTRLWIRATMSSIMLSTLQALF